MINLMPKKPEDKPVEAGTTPFQMRLPNAMRAQLMKLVKENETDLSEEVRSAIRLYLKENQLWPPSAPQH